MRDAYNEAAENIQDEVEEWMGYSLPEDTDVWEMDEIIYLDNQDVTRCMFQGRYNSKILIDPQNARNWLEEMQSSHEEDDLMEQVREK